MSIKLNYQDQIVKVKKDVSFNFKYKKTLMDQFILDNQGQKILSNLLNKPLIKPLQKESNKTRQFT